MRPRPLSWRSGKKLRHHMNPELMRGLKLHLTPFHGWQLQIEIVSSEGYARTVRYSLSREEADIITRAIGNATEGIERLRWRKSGKNTRTADISTSLGTPTSSVGTSEETTPTKTGKSGTSDTTKSRDRSNCSRRPSLPAPPPWVQPSPAKGCRAKSKKRMRADPDPTADTDE